MNTTMRTDVELPSDNFVILDTETGGLNPYRNPLLSVGLVSVRAGQIDKTLSVRFRAPENTWLEVPIAEDQLRGKMQKTISYWVNLDDGKTVPVSDNKPLRLITAIAAEVNGFVGSSETSPGWDLGAVGRWGGETYADGEALVARFLDEVKPEAVVGHHCDFDHKFIRAWIPSIEEQLPCSWYCTQTVYMKHLSNGVRKGSNLGALCKMAGYEPVVDTLHTAVGDCIATYHVWKWLREKLS
jgi:DNA polymerase III epsilon subunit-like protein